MEQVVEGYYKEFQQPKQMEPSLYYRFSNDQSSGQEIVLGHVKVQTPHNRILKKIVLKPVYVTEDTNELVYNSRMMEKGKKYYVVWDGERFMLIKDDKDVIIYKFETDVD